MPSSGWQELVKSSWGDCVILHNLPLCLSQEITSVKTKTSIYELQKTAKTWELSCYGVTKSPDSKM